MRTPPSEGTPRAELLKADRRLHELATACPIPKEGHLLRLWGARFAPFQRCWLFDPSSFAICCKARQIGLSHTTAACGVLWGVFFGEMTTIISKDKDASKNVLAMSAKLAAVLRRGGSQAARMVTQNKEQIVFGSGGSIVALPSTGGRSYSGNVILDEYAYQEHAKDVWDAAAPVASLGHKMRVLSTPNGVGNEFHDLWEYATNERPSRMTGRRSQWNPHYIPLRRAVADGFKVDIDKCWELAKGDPRIFGQFYECNFLDTEFQYIPTEVIDGCLVHDRVDDKEDGVYYAGLDIGREVDLSVLVVIKQWSKAGKTRHRVVWVECIKRTDQAALEEMVSAAFERFSLKRICIDRTGIGSFPAESIKEKHSEKYDPIGRRPRVHCVDFSTQSKEGLATGLYAMMTTRSLELPSTDAAIPTVRRMRPNGTFVVANEPGTSTALKREIASLQRRITRAANVVYETPRTREGHADRAWALMLACSAVDPIHPILRALAGGAA